MRPLYRLGLLILGLVFAIPAAFAALAVGLALDPVGRDLVGNLGLAGLSSVMGALIEGEPPGAALEGAASLGMGLFALLAVPPALAAIIGEVLAWRSFVWYGAAAGLVTAALPWSERSVRAGERAAEAVGAEGRITAILFLVGATSGLVYWLIAGRSAGPVSPSRVV